jgi:hypothetical protein
MLLPFSSIPLIEFLPASKRKILEENDSLEHPKWTRLDCFIAERVYGPIRTDGKIWIYNGRLGAPDRVVTSRPEFYRNISSDLMNGVRSVTYGCWHKQ